MHVCELAVRNLAEIEWRFVHDFQNYLTLETPHHIIWSIRDNRTDEYKFAIEKQIYCSVNGLPTFILLEFRLSWIELGVRNDDIRDSRSVSDCLDLVDIWIAELNLKRPRTGHFWSKYRICFNIKNTCGIRILCTIVRAFNLMVKGWVFGSLNSTEWLWISYEAWKVLNLKVRIGLRLLLLSDTYTFVFDLGFWII